MFAALAYWRPLERRHTFSVQMQDAGGKLATFDLDHTKARWTWKGFARLGNLRVQREGERRWQ